MIRLLILRLFQLLMFVIAALSTYEIAAIGPDADRGDRTSTITWAVTGNDFTTAVAAIAAATFGIGLAIHFILARRDRQ